jgi:hypothetical protein
MFIVSAIRFALYDLASSFESAMSWRDVQKVIGFPSYGYGRARSKLLEAVCFAVVAMRGFGGKERKLFYKEVVPYGQVYCDGMTWDRTGLVYTVAGKSTVMTGKYYPPSGGQGFDGDWDYEPGGLEDMQCHVLLDIGGEKIEQCDVELMKGVGA